MDIVGVARQLYYLNPPFVNEVTPYQANIQGERKRKSDIKAAWNV
jgi:hypothetical protein